MKENDFAVTVLGWREFKRKIWLITTIVFFVAFTIGFCVGCGVEHSLSGYSFSGTENTHTEVAESEKHRS